ncbi:MAG: FkbM family methyltransferase [Actinomycetota bacterium]
MGDSNGEYQRGLPTKALSAATSLVPKSFFHPVVARLHLRAEPEMRGIIERCDPTGTTIDVGTWFGPWTYWLSKRVRDVQSFEPNPNVAAVLRSGVASNVTVHECAVSDVDGTAELVLQDLSIGSEGTATIVPGIEGAGSHSVKTVRIDDMGFTDVRFIKIDVEGHENAVINGAHEIITRDHPVLFVELEERMTDIDGTIAMMAGLGYEARFVMNDVWTSSESIDLAAWQREFTRTHKTQSYLQTVVNENGYVHDVAFVHPQSTWAPWD